MAIETTLARREDTGLPRRLARSAAAVRSGASMGTSDFPDWFAARRRNNRFRVRRIPFAALERWSVEPGTGNLVHGSGRFFRVEGLRVTTGDGAPPWHQPVIVQPEIGVLGILAKEFDGVLHFLID